MAHGWERLAGSTSWNDTLEDVSSLELFAGYGGTGGTNVTGIDSFQAAAVPEPSSLALTAFVVTCLVCFLSRRRTACEPRKKPACSMASRRDRVGPE